MPTPRTCKGATWLALTPRAFLRRSCPSYIFLVSKVSNDPIPVLGGPLDAATQPIANVAVTQAAIDTFNAVHNTQYTVSDLVINKAYADSNYQTKDVPGGGIRLADEPTDASAYTITINSLNLGNMVVNYHIA